MVRHQAGTPPARRHQAPPRGTWPGRQPGAHPPAPRLRATSHPRDSRIAAPLVCTTEWCCQALLLGAVPVWLCREGVRLLRRCGPPLSGRVALVGPASCKEPRTPRGAVPCSQGWRFFSCRVATPNRFRTPGNMSPSRLALVRFFAGAGWRQ